MWVKRVEHLEEGDLVYLKVWNHQVKSNGWYRVLKNWRVRIPGTHQVFFTPTYHTRNKQNEALMLHWNQLVICRP